VQSVRSHYETFLAPVYAWLAGGAQAAFAQGDAELDALRLTATRRSAIALDLGAGFGMHSVPLARRGFSVVAVDSSAALLGELRGHAGALPIGYSPAFWSTEMSTWTSTICCTNARARNGPSASAVTGSFASRPIGYSLPSGVPASR
jgi:hypothetical protein